MTPRTIRYLRLCLALTITILTSPLWLLAAAMVGGAWLGLFAVYGTCKALDWATEELGIDKWLK